MSSYNSILFCYGEGGHAAQMNRLAPKLVEDLESYNIVSLSDINKKPTWSNVHYTTGELRGKYSNLALLTNLGPLYILKSLVRINWAHRVKVVITTGPGIGILSSLFFKLKGVKIIHIETWSRFTSKSFTGRVMYKIADKFYVQNKELKHLYPKAVYSGKL